METVVVAILAAGGLGIYCLNELLSALIDARFDHATRLFQLEERVRRLEREEENGG